MFVVIGFIPYRRFFDVTELGQRKELYSSAQQHPSPYYSPGACLLDYKVLLLPSRCWLHYSQRSYKFEGRNYASSEADILFIAGLTTCATNALLF